MYEAQDMSGGKDYALKVRYGFIHIMNGIRYIGAFHLLCRTATGHSVKTTDRLVISSQCSVRLGIPGCRLARTVRPPKLLQIKPIPHGAGC